MADEFPYYFNPDLDEDTNKKVNLEIMKYAGMYLLKKIDLPPEEGGHVFEVPLSGLDEHLEPILDDLLFHDLIDIDSVSTRYALTKDGNDYVAKLIDEIEDYIDDYDEYDATTKVNLMKKNNINPLRARFLWGLYDGEFDDFEDWQDEWNFPSDQRSSDWRDMITKKEFYDFLFEQVNNMEDMDNAELDEIMREAEEERQKNVPEIKITRVEGSSGISSRRGNGGEIVEREYYHDPYYFNPVYDPLFWYVVF